MAAVDETGSFEAVWQTVRRWPVEDQRLLASQILASLGGEEAGRSTQASPADVIGAWRSAGQVDDATVQAVLEDELLRKHL